MMCRMHAAKQLGGLLICLSAAIAAQSAQAATVCVNEAAPAPLEICVKDDGTPMVWVDQSGSRVRQYFATDAWGSVIWLNGADGAQKYATSYYGATAVTPISNVVTGAGTPSDPFVITNVTDLGASGVRMTQRFTYVDGDRVFKKSWLLENTGAATFNDVRFFHGGDTYFGGSDYARSWYDATLKMVYVTNPTFTDTGYMGFYANPATPFAHYFSGHYWTGYGYAATTAELPDTFDSSFQDAGYHLQWNRATLAPGEIWSFEAFETWSPPGAVQVLSPAEQYVTPGASVRKTFRVQNLDDSNSQSITLNVVATPAGWTASLPDGANITLTPLEVVEVHVDVQVPANANEGDSEEIYLTATAVSTSNTGMTRLSVPVTDYAFSPTHLDFGNVRPNETGEVELTLTNGPGGAIQIGDVAGANALAAPFTIVSDTCSNVSLAANESCTVRVRFAPTSTGTYAESFNVPVVAPTLVDHTISIEGTSAETHTVTVTAGSGGSVSPGTVEVIEGETQSFTITPNAGYRIATVTGCSGTLVGNVYTVTAVTSACSINVTFEPEPQPQPETHTVSAAAGSGGSISPSTVEVIDGETQSFTITPNAGYRIATVTGCDGTLVGNVYTVTAVTSACSINATFESETYTLAISSGSGGGISPSAITAALGQQATFTITPDAGYSIASVTGCGGTLSGNTYTTAPINGPCSVTATFTKTTTDVVVTGRGQGGGGSFGLGSLLLGAVVVAIRRLKSRTALAAAVASVAAANASAADLEERGFYAGASLGQAASSESTSDLARHLHSAGYDVQPSIDDDRLGWRVFGGWTLNRYIAFEGGYTDLGEVTTSYSGTIFELDVEDFLNEAVVAHPRSATGFDASVVVRLPLGSRWWVAAEAGAFFWDAERRVRDNVGRSARRNDDGVDARYGVSAGAKLFGNLDVFAGWNRFELDSEHVDLPALGLRYRW